MEKMINNKYVLLHKIGSGSFGAIYRGQNKRTTEYVAIKVEPIRSGTNLLKNESKIYQYLLGCEYVPRVKWYGKDDSAYYMVIDLLGHSLQDCINQVSTFSLALILKIGMRLFAILHAIHERRLVHRDIKPDNFLFDAHQQQQLYLVDFGICKVVQENRPSNGFVGSKNYASIRAHEYLELSARDDLESTAYMMLYFYAGWLPWNGDDRLDDILVKKTAIENSERYPIILLDVLRYARNLEHGDIPDYSILSNMFSRELDILSKTG